MCPNFNVKAAFNADVRHAAFPLLLREHLLAWGESLGGGFCLPQLCSIIVQRFVVVLRHPPPPPTPVVLVR